ncbi:hypothetical protein FRB97_000158 [Tulasnella sp. 331]|nr:hypothetical protein FRB97_000158 [Tulasnella sp. 331]KAG8884266.1 hypothetical protein FRB98_002539 [Tulasnella sp. 332]
MQTPTFDPHPTLKYLSLPDNYAPSPSTDAVEFLQKHLLNLPPSLLSSFSLILTPRQRTMLVKIRNRRTTWASSQDGVRELSWQNARRNDPISYETYMIAAAGNRGAPLAGSSDPCAPDREIRRGEEEGQDERRWAEVNFLGSANEYTRHVGQGKFAELLGKFEEEREAERHRELRAEARKKEQEEEESYEEEEDSDEEAGRNAGLDAEQPFESPEQARQSFERTIRERFIDGRLEARWIEYDNVDYDDQWDRESLDDEERWFDDEEED